MATEFWTDVEQGKQFELRFKTDNREYFNFVQEAARSCIDGRGMPVAFGIWRSVSEPPEMWRDKKGELVNYLIFMPEYGVDIGNYMKFANRWICMGLPVEVTHWMPLLGGPKLEMNKEN